MIGLATDSASMLPAAWRDRFEVQVAPMTVVVDGEAHLEGRDLTTAAFYRRLADGAEVSTATPSPGELAAAYQRCRDAGADRVVAIHTGADYSAVLSAAAVAARQVEGVELVDSGTVSFPVALCLAAAADARAAGVDADRVAAAARETAALVDSVFVVGAPDLAQRGGRLGDVGSKPGLTLLGLGPGGVRDLGAADDLDDAIARMAGVVARAATGSPLRVGVGDADRPDLGARLADAVAAAGGALDLVRYEVGPSVGAHTGAGTVGAVWAPATDPV